MRGVAVSAAWEPACMEPDELELYRAGRARGCQDCTSDFAALMAREGRCNGIPGDIAHETIIPLIELLEAPDGRTPILNPDGTRRPYRPQLGPRKERPVEDRTEPTPLRRRYSSQEAIALSELADAARNAADLADQRATIEKSATSADERLAIAAKAAGFNKRTKPPGRKPWKNATRTETSG